MHFCDEDSLSDTFTIPFWAARLSKKNLQTLQLSIRGGEISCRHNSDRVILVVKPLPSLVERFLFKKNSFT